METLSILTYRKIEKSGLISFLNDWAAKCEFKIHEADNVEEALRRVIKFYNELVDIYNAGAKDFYLNFSPLSNSFFVGAGAYIQNNCVFTDSIFWKDYMDIYILYALCKIYDKSYSIFDLVLHCPSLYQYPYMDSAMRGMMEDYIDDFYESKESSLSNINKTDAINTQIRQNCVKEAYKFSVPQVIHLIKYTGLPSKTGTNIEWAALLSTLTGLSANTLRQNMSNAKETLNDAKSEEIETTYNEILNKLKGKK
ncbi:MAG: hypothetical protein KBT33_01625 [Prevotellaceae bacterium]|nr:hypothetical protein [Candidatus Minthosoma equi]